MKHLNSQISFVNDIFSKGQEDGFIKLRAFHDESTGSFFHVKGKILSNFICNNYLAFEMDERVKQAAIEGIQRFGLQTSISRTYLSFDHFNELEEKLEHIFGLPTIIASCTALGNLAYIPLIVGPNDAIILDQFVHESVKMSANLMKADGRHVETIKHSQMEVLEKRIKTLRETYENVWYMADSVYSMHGDTAPLKDIETLLNTYDNFYVYIDDAHGMSWVGQNGKGFTLNTINKHPKLYVITALNKGFGAMSSALIFPDRATKNFVETCNAAIRFSAPTPHAGILAASKIADIHLSDEIYEKQARLNELIVFFKKRAQELNLPIINYTHTPIFFLATGGNTENLFKFSKHFMDSGFLMSVATLPVVPIAHSGYRISLSLYQDIKSIDKLLNTIAEFMEDLERKGLFNREEALKGFKINNKERERILTLV
jgi:7-keto-8-aminopelargonate synthetase-like enzyme